MTKLTIGMPVYNGAATIRAALNSLLAQTHTEFQIIISDNGSTDETQAICLDYAARDVRIRYVRQAVNLGPAMNFRFVLFEANTSYFMWAAADDLWAPTFAARQIEVLEQDASVVMSQSRVLFTVNGQPSHVSTGTYALLGDARTNAARYFQNPADNSRYYGVFRTEALKRVFPPRSFHALDWAVAAATLRAGKHNEIRDVLMIRDSSDATVYEQAVKKDHDFILWRVFPVLFMTIWVLKRRLVPLSLPLFYRLAKLNMYMHFRFGVYKIGSLAERYVATHNLFHALGLRPTTISAVVRPGWKTRLKQRAVTLMRGVWRRAPLSLEQRQKVKVTVFRTLGRHVQDLDSYQAWRPASTLSVTPPPHVQELAGWRTPVAPTAPADLTIVVIHNSQLPDLLQALQSIADLAGPHQLETIVAFPKVGDVAPLALAEMAGVRLAEVEGAPSPADLMNAGIALASGEHVLIVGTQSWLHPHFATAVLEGLEAAAIIAPQIQYSDGRLAAAGGVISYLTGAWRHGHLDGAPDSPAYAFARDVDHAPFAFAARRDVLTEIGPMDAGLKTFDLTVADWCVRARAVYGPVLYWPMAKLSTLAVDTGTIDPDGWADDWLAISKRHASALEIFRTMDGEGRVAHDRGRPLRMLYVDAETPAPDLNSGSIDAFNLMRIFGDLGFRVTFVPESNFVHRGIYTEALQKIGVEAIYHPSHSSVREVIERAERPFDVVVLCRAYIAERYVQVVRSLLPHAKIIFNTVDLHFLREEREAALSRDSIAAAAAARTKASEMCSIANCDATIVLSTFERDILTKELPQASVYVLPLVRQVPEELEAPGPEARRDVMFVGTYQHPPNQDAAVYFAKEVWPLVHTELPDARFLLVGSSVTPTVQALAGNGIEVVGYVPDLGPLLDRCRVSVAPLRFGAGLKGKLATALQAGLPTVATTIATEGTALVDGREVLIADTPRALADAVIRLYRDDAQWRDIAAAGFAFVKREYSVEANIARAVPLLRDLGISTYQIEHRLLEADLAAGEEVFRPSKFWTKLSNVNTAALAGERIYSFKRTVNNNYMQWLPGSSDDPRVRPLMDAFAEKPSMVPVEVVAESAADTSLAADVRGYGGFNPFLNPDYFPFYAFYVGLLWHFVSTHDAERLHEKLSEPLLGMPIPLRHKGRLISQDLASSILEYSRITELTRTLPLRERPTYLELGAGYGRLAYVFLNARRCRYVIVDIPPTILVSKWYLSRIFSDLKIFSYRPFSRYEDVAAEMDAADIVFLSPNQLALLPAAFADVTISISSLHEMGRHQMARYKQLLSETTATAIYFKQWRTWRNPEDQIDVGPSDYELSTPWSLVLDSVDCVNTEFIEMGWIRRPKVPTVNHE